MPRKISSRSLPPLGRFVRIKKKERKRENKARDLMAEFQNSNLKHPNRFEN
jgi:hypothetical protein